MVSAVRNYDDIKSLDDIYVVPNIKFYLEKTAEISLNFISKIFETNDEPERDEVISFFRNENNFLNYFKNINNFTNLLIPLFKKNFPSKEKYSKFNSQILLINSKLKVLFSKESLNNKNLFENNLGFFLESITNFSKIYNSEDFITQTNKLKGYITYFKAKNLEIPKIETYQKNDDNLVKNLFIYYINNMINTIGNISETNINNIYKLSIMEDGFKFGYDEIISSYNNFKKESIKIIEYRELIINSDVFLESFNILFSKDKNYIAYKVDKNKVYKNVSEFKFALSRYINFFKVNEDKFNSLDKDYLDFFKKIVVELSKIRLNFTETIYIISQDLVNR